MIESLDEDLRIKLSRLKDPYRETPRIFPIVRKSDAEPTPGCFLCNERFFQRVTVLLENDQFIWHTKDYFYIPGDSMITSKAHQDGYNSVAPQEFADFLEIVNTASMAYHQVSEIDRITVLQAVGGRVAGQGVENHFHAHVFPKYRKNTERDIAVYSWNNFVIQDASSFYLAKMMQRQNPRLLSFTKFSNIFPGGFEFDVEENTQAALAILQDLERSFFQAMSQTQRVVRQEPNTESKIAQLGEAAQIPLNTRRKGILRWMAKAFSQEDLHLFGYNLFLDNHSFLFLPRSGIVGGKRIGAVSIFGNLHWSTKSLGDEKNSAVYRAPYEDYPRHFIEFDKRIVSQVRHALSPPLEKSPA